jgi:hypothetical protein
VTTSKSMPLTFSQSIRCVSAGKCRSPEPLVEIGDVTRPHRQQRPAHARIADAAAVQMHVVSRRGIFRVLVDVPRIGAPLGLPSMKFRVGIAAPVIAVDLIGEGRREEDEWLPGAAFGWQYIERHDVLEAAAAQPHAIYPGRHVLGDLDGEIRCPVAVVQIVLVKMDRGIVARRVAPVGFPAGPARPCHGTHRQVQQYSMQTMRPAVLDAGCRDVGAEIPPGETLHGGRLDRRRFVMDAGEDRGIFNAAVEKSAKRVVARLRSGGHRRTERHLVELSSRAGQLRLPAIGHTPTALQRRLPQAQATIGDQDPQLIPAPFEHRRRHLNAAAGDVENRSFRSDRKGDPVLQRQYGLRPPVEQPGLDANHNGARTGERQRYIRDDHPARPLVHRLKARCVVSRKRRRELDQLDAGPGRVGVTVNDPHQVGPVGLSQGAGNLDLDPLARPSREPIDITNQRYHAPTLPMPMLRVIGWRQPPCKR